MSDGNPEYRQIRYDEYSKQRADLAKTNIDLAGRFDQWILTLSAGGLGLSLAFLEKIAPHPRPNTTFLLGIAWFFLALGLLAGLLSLLTAQYSALRQIDILDDEWKTFMANTGKDSKDAPVSEAARLNKYTEYTHLLNCIAAPGFVLGVVFLCLFAYSNVPDANPTPLLPPKVDVNVTVQNPTPVTNTSVNTNKP